MKLLVRYTTMPILLLAFWASAAQALSPFYLTAKVGDARTDVEIDTFSAVVDGDAPVLSLGVGLKIGRILVFQAEYQDFGSVSGTGSVCADPVPPCMTLAVPVEIDSTAVSVSVLPHLKLTERVHVYGKLGFVSWSSDLSAIEAAGEEFLDDFDDEDLLYGAGLRFFLPGPFSAFGEYESIADNFETISVGATFGF